MGMKNQRDGRVFFLALVIAALQTALGAVNITSGI